MKIIQFKRRFPSAGLLSITLALASVPGYRSYSLFAGQEAAGATGIEAPATRSATSSSAPSTRSVAERIRSEIPHYEELDDFERVDAIRQWVYAHVDLSASPELLIDDKSHPLHLGSVDDNFLRVFNDRGGYWCGGTAYLASQAYTAMGFPAVMYNCGNGAMLTHVVALVQVEGQWYAQDAYFNLAYVDEAGKPLPFLDVLKQLAAGHVPDQRLGKPVHKDVHSSKPVTPGEAQQVDWSLGISGPVALKKQLSDTHFVYRAHPTIKDFLTFLPPENGLFSWLESEGLQRNLSCLLLYPLGLNDKGLYYTEPARHPLFELIASTITQARAEVLADGSVQLSVPAATSSQ